MPNPSFPRNRGTEEAVDEWYTPRQVSLPLDLPSLTFHLEWGTCNPSTPSPRVPGRRCSPAFPWTCIPSSQLPCQFFENEFLLLPQPSVHPSINLWHDALDALPTSAASATPASCASLSETFHMEDRTSPPAPPPGLPLLYALLPTQPWSPHFPLTTLHSPLSLLPGLQRQGHIALCTSASPFTLGELSTHGRGLAVWPYRPQAPQPLGFPLHPPKSFGSTETKHRTDFISINFNIRSVFETWLCHLLAIWFGAEFNFFVWKKKNGFENTYLIGLSRR